MKVTAITLRAVCSLALLMLTASSAPAALISFGGLDGGIQGSAVPNSYQPLLNTYSGTSGNGNSTPTPLAYTDGANIGVTITWDGGSSLSYRATNGGVTD